MSFGLFERGVLSPHTEKLEHTEFFRCVVAAPVAVEAQSEPAVLGCQVACFARIHRRTFASIQHRERTPEHGILKPQPTVTQGSYFTRRPVFRGVAQQADSGPREKRDGGTVLRLERNGPVIVCLDDANPASFSEAFEPVASHAANNQVANPVLALVEQCLDWKGQAAMPDASRKNTVRDRVRQRQLAVAVFAKPVLHGEQVGEQSGSATVSTGFSLPVHRR